MKMTRSGKLSFPPAFWHLALGINILISSTVWQLLDVISLQEWQESMLRRTVALSGILVSSRVF
jgi:hypothetical protein